MAVYTTFFLCKPEELPRGFPGWRPPLPTPVRRQFKNPFTGQISTIETREPEWSDEQGDAFEREYQVVSIEGAYEDYLEGRLPPSVGRWPHWAAKGLTELELRPLAEAMGLRAEFDFPLYAPRSSGATLQELPPEMLTKLPSIDQAGLEGVAEKWAATMSTPCYTHSASGRKLNEGWTANEAMEILECLLQLAQQAEPGQHIYLLIEV
jgi:hypothetical protein